MPTTPRSQSALAADPNFQKRLSSLLLSEAIVVADQPAPTPDPENPALTADYQKRRQLAQQILTQPTQQAYNLGPAICNGTNLVAANTTYNFEAGAIETSATDAEIRSQISTLWDTLAGV